MLFICVPQNQTDLININTKVNITTRHIHMYRYFISFKYMYLHLHCLRQMCIYIVLIYIVIVFLYTFTFNRVNEWYPRHSTHKIIWHKNCFKKSHNNLLSMKMVCTAHIWGPIFCFCSFNEGRCSAVWGRRPLCSPAWLIGRCNQKHPSASSPGLKKINW